MRHEVRSEGSASASAIGREIRAENDADCLAASEAVDGAGAGFNVVYAVILGSSTGAGIAVGGRAHHGPNNNAGEWAHNPLPFPDITEIPGPPCFCGKHSCLASWVSGLAADDIIRKMRSGDRLARLVWRRYVNRLARGLSLVANALDPDIFVMGGGMSNVDELYTDLPPELGSNTSWRWRLWETTLAMALCHDDRIAGAILGKN